MIGHNDLCLKSCFSFLDSLVSRVRVEPEDYERNIRRALDYLSTHLPHTLVVLLSPADVTAALAIVDKPPVCILSHTVECPCLFATHREQAVRRVKWLWQSYGSVIMSVFGS